jgi:DNA ligase D-like protein (predicted polymerase)
MSAPAVEFELDGRTIRLTSEDRVYFPDLGLTKGDVFRYFLSVGEGILRAVRDRPTALERWPKGVHPGMVLAPDPSRPPGKGDAFFQKRLPKRGAPDWLETVLTLSPNGTPAETFCPTDLAAVMWAVNMGTLRFHPMPIRAGDVERPDLLRIDLDPQDGVGFDEAVQVAAVLREVLAEHGLTGFPKTSGGRGIHVTVPIRPDWDHVGVRRAVIALGREVARRVPELATIAWWKEERGARIFLDYNQVALGKMVTAAYSVRPVAAATVSAPVEWEELESCRPEDFTVRTMPERFAAIGDLQFGLDALAFDLDSVMELADRHDAEGIGGELPYPPMYPKMPGEPRRVQPSRARKDIPD